MTKRRMKGRENWPVGMRKRNSRGITRYSLILVTGEEWYFPKGVDETTVIETCTKYNDEHRTFKVRKRKYKPVNSKDKPISDWSSEIESRIKDYEKMNDETYRTFCLDLERLVKWFGSTYTMQIDLSLVNAFLENYEEERLNTTGKRISNNVYNRKIVFLKQVFSYLIDKGAMIDNFAACKKPKRKKEKVRNRLSIEIFNAIKESAPPFLRVAMDLSLQTTHAVLEISRMKYSDCVWNDEPEEIDGQTVYGQILINRQKVEHTDSSLVSIPITNALKGIIDYSRLDNVDSPYIVHLSKRRGKTPQSCSHWSQVDSKFLSKEFSKARDRLNLYPACKDKALLPTFHEIRSLSITLYYDNGYCASVRAAHNSKETTEKYRRGYKKVNYVDPAELRI